jgi:hypothetical protein
MLNSTNADQIRCPTCAATQSPAAECRRCKCDLSLYLTTLRSCQWWKRQVLVALREGRYDHAVQAAQQYATLTPDRDAVRWIAVARLLQCRFEEALSVSSR